MTRSFLSLPARFCAAAPRKPVWLSSARLCRVYPSASSLRTVSQPIIIKSFSKMSESGLSGCPRAFQTLTLGVQDADRQNSHQKDGSQATKFRLRNDCLLALHRGDITKWSVDGKTDAIVNAANNRMLGGGGVDGAIHRAAGPDLYQACLKLPLVGKNIRCRTGDAVITQGFRLPASKVIHTVGPRYNVDEKHELLLKNSYKSSLFLAGKSGIKYLAFPAISCGVYGYPYDEASEIALDTVDKYSEGLKEVHFVLFEEESWSAWLAKACNSFQRLLEE